MRTWLVAAAAVLVAGCTSAQFTQLNATLMQAEAGRAARLATSATIAQLALVHMAAALSQAAAQDIGDGTVSTLTGAPAPDAEFSYELDNAAGTARVLRTHGGRRSVDLAFTFAAERGNAGMAYTVTGTTGQFEGYQLFFPRLTLVFSAMLGADMQPAKHENGYTLFNVDIDAMGSLGTRGTESMRLSKATFGLTYPISAGEAQVGALTAVGADGNVFDGRVMLANKSLRLEGAIKDAAGIKLYDLKAGPDGGMSLSKPTNGSDL